MEVHCLPDWSAVVQNAGEPGGDALCGRLNRPSRPPSARRTRRGSARVLGPTIYPTVERGGLGQDPPVRGRGGRHRPPDPGRAGSRWHGRWAAPAPGSWAAPPARPPYSGGVAHTHRHACSRGPNRCDCPFGPIAPVSPLSRSLAAGLEPYDTGGKEVGGSWAPASSTAILVRGVAGSVRE